MKTKSRNLIISFLLTLAMLLGVFAISPMTASALSLTPTPEETPAETVYVGGVALSKGQYVKNGETTATTGEPDWEESGFAFYASSGTFHLSDYEYEGTGYTHDTSEKSVIYSEGKLEIILHGTSSIKNTADTELWSANGIRTKGNLIIDGPGSITINAPYAIYGNNLVKFEYGRTVIPSATVAIEAGGNFIVNGGVLELHSTQPIYAGASFISGGSFFATSEQGVFQTAPMISVNTEDEYYLNICTDVEGNIPAAYAPENIRQYKYFKVVPPTLTEINSISVSGVTLPALGGKVGDAGYGGATYGGNYYVFDMYVDMFVGDTWVAAEDTTSIVAGVKYRVVLGIEPEEGYTISADIAGTDVLINGQQATEYEIFEYPDYNSIDICYEFHYGELIDPLIESIEISDLTLPIAGQTAADWDFNPGMLAFGGNYGFHNCGMQKYTGTEWVPMGAGDTTILTNVKYRFFIELSADEGYFFSPELTSDDVTIGDYDAVLLAVNVSGELAVVAAEFYYEASSTTPITSISVSGADLPEVGETKDVVEFTPDTLTYGGEYKMVGRGFQKYTGTEWVDLSDTESLEYGVKYRLNLVLAPNEGYVFADSITSDDVTFNGKDAEFLGFANAGTAKYARIALEFSYEAPATDYGIKIADKDDSGATVGVLITEENCTDVLGDGTVSFDPTTSTLTLNGYKYEGEGCNFEGGYLVVTAEIEESLTIKLIGENKIDISGVYGSGFVILGDGDVRFIGDGSLTIDALMYGISVQSGDLIVESGNVTIDCTGMPSAAISATNFYMIGGNLKLFSAFLGIGMMSSESDMVFEGGVLEVSVNNAGYCFVYSAGGDMTFNPMPPEINCGACDAIASTNTSGGEAVEYNPDDIATYKYAKITEIESYGITIADKDDSGATVGVLITKENYTDVLGDGTVSFDPETNTLTLNGYKYEGGGFADGACHGIIVDSIGTLNIVLKGENVIDVTKTDTLERMRRPSIGIDTWETNVAISGDGSLIISATSGGLYVDGEEGNPSLEIKGGNITVNAPWVISAAYFKMSGGNLTVNATGTDGDIAGAIYTYEFRMSGGSLKITSAGLGVEMWHESDEDAPPMISGGSLDISVAIAGGTFCYYNYADDVCVSIAPDLTNYVGSYKMTAGANADGTGATDYNASDIATYKYVKLDSLHVHDHGTAWESDANNHWKECSCGDKANLGAHNDGNSDGKCDVCDYQMANGGGNTENPDKPKDGLSGGAIAGIVVGSVAVAGIGGFAVVWFIVKKKSFADLIAIFKKR